jgi:hypothetical protein
MWWVLVLTGWCCEPLRVLGWRDQSGVGGLWLLERRIVWLPFRLQQPPSNFVPSPPTLLRPFNLVWSLFHPLWGSSFRICFLTFWLALIWHRKNAVNYGSGSKPLSVPSSHSWCHLGISMLGNLQPAVLSPQTGSGFLIASSSAKEWVEISSPPWQHHKSSRTFMPVLSKMSSSICSNKTQTLFVVFITMVLDSILDFI